MTKWHLFFFFISNYLGFGSSYPFPRQHKETVKKRKNLGFPLHFFGYKLNLWFSSSGAFGLVVEAKLWHPHHLPEGLL
jgi:hypothetical protein